MKMLDLLKPKSKASRGDRCPSCERGVLYQIGDRLCCSACLKGWPWETKR